MRMLKVVKAPFKLARFACEGGGDVLKAEGERVKGGSGGEEMLIG